MSSAFKNSKKSIANLYNISDDVACVFDWNGSDHITFANSAPSCAVVCDWLVWLSIDITHYSSIVINYTASTCKQHTGEITTQV